MIPPPKTIGIAGSVWKPALPSMQPSHRQPSQLQEGSPLVVCAASDTETPDFLVMYGDVAAPYATAVPFERRIVVITEPPSIVRYQPAFLAQFGTVISPFEQPGYGGRFILSQPGLPWFYGCTFGKGREPAWRYDFDALENLPRPDKINAVSAVLSKKVQAPLHVARVRCAEAIAQAFPGNVRIFGSGFDPIDDKADAIDPYRFHLALENTRHSVYWSEKIADAYLGWAMPIYEGCTGMASYFPEKSFARIDVTNPESAIRVVGDLLEAGEKAVSIEALTEARRRLLHEHSLPALLKREVLAFADGAMVADTTGVETLRPNSAFSLRGRVRSLIRTLRGRR